MMKKLWLLFLFLSHYLHALEHAILLDNEKVRVLRIKIMPGEEVGLHRDELPSVVIAQQEGTITRLEDNQTTTDVHFPLNTPIFRPIDPEGELHKSINRSPNTIELLVIQIKD